ncbi:hypothetical protein FGO68_gene4767 [Halteria grandinella]|uniref:Uncharacterized protein n=1 Tax=Halteria grandinella TaxID=5974 RepID=A0A8J8P774_HALGN|nr:hypothetical protein FGO68_gene4767 [Halteria grandinella]
MFAISNLGSTFIFLFALVGILALVILLKILSFLLPFKLLEFLDRKLSQNFIWNVPIRFLIQQYQSIFISSLIAINLTLNSFQLSQEDFLSLTQTFAQQLDVFTSLILLLIGTIMPLVMAVIIRQFRKVRKLKSPLFIAKYGTIMEGIKNVKKGEITGMQSIALYWNAIMIARWGMSIAIFVYLKDQASLQVICLLMISLLFTSLVAYAKPFNIDDTRAQGGFFVINENYFKLLNEIFVSYYLIVLMMLTDITPDIEFRATFGMIELGIVVTCVLTNVFKSILAITNQYLIRKRKQMMIESLKQAILSQQLRKNEELLNQTGWRQDGGIDLSLPYYNFGDNLPNTFIRIKAKPEPAQFTMKETATNLTRFEDDQPEHQDQSQVLRRVNHQLKPFNQQNRPMFFNQ